MSSEDGDLPDIPAAPVKRRRIQRACDVCRQKRRACDGLRMSMKKCSYCIENGIDCTYSGAVTTTKRKSYTEVLEARLALTEKLLRKLSKETSSSPPTTTSSSEWSKDSPVLQHAAAASSSSTVGPGVELATLSIRALSTSADPVHEDPKLRELQEDMQTLALSSHTDQFMGESSGALLVQTAVQLKEGYTTGAPPETIFPTPWGARRMEYWTFKPWEPSGPPARRRYAFPPPDLLGALVSLYFENSNIYMPLLHRPTFERALAAGDHLRDDKFGANVLLVCAVASRFSSDPRVLDGGPLKCGWGYFSQVSTELGHLFEPPVLYDLQRYCLAIQFFDGSTPQANWTLIGIGIRIAQEVGAHRQHGNLGPPTVDSEQWTRAFWVLVCYDRLVSCTLGRPCAIQADDFDVDLPTECDDEYWEPADGDRTKAFRQPPDAPPSRVAFFNAFVRLNNILAFTLRILYSLNKAKDLLAVRAANWESQLVAELDSALNTWVDAIPAHLCWDAHRKDPVFFRQSVALYCAYYHVQMTTHRPFIPTVRSAAPTVLPSLAICTNAARSCAHVADVASRRMPNTPAIIMLPGLTTAGVVLLLNVWSAKRTGLAPHLNTALSEVHKCMRAMQVCEARWQMAGLFWDVLNELASVGAPSPPPAPAPAPVPPRPAPANAHKRAHSEADRGRYRSTQMQTPDVWADSFDADAFAWVGAPQQGQGQAQLPMYSADLGRLPIYAPAQAEPNSQWPAYGAPAHPGWTDPAQFGAPFDPGTSVGADWIGTGAGVLENDDALAMWANAPAGLGAVEWGTYFGVMNDAGRQQHHHPQETQR
ncbi:fungal-specific transcription factor domain-containing protein [Mycena latifolia]|nr:fungal-specific transcription factor domain-containing protein [Mycena latifolia]